MTEWETLKTQGPTPGLKTIGAHVPAALHRKYMEAAEKRGVKLSQILRLAMFEWYRRNEESPDD